MRALVCSNFSDFVTWTVSGFCSSVNFGRFIHFIWWDSPGPPTCRLRNISPADWGANWEHSFKPRDFPKLEAEQSTSADLFQSVGSPFNSGKEAKHTHTHTHDFNNLIRWLVPGQFPKLRTCKNKATLVIGPPAISLSAPKNSQADEWVIGC